MYVYECVHYSQRKIISDNNRVPVSITNEYTRQHIGRLKRFNVNCIVNKLYLPEEADRIRLLQRLKLPLISLE